MFQILITFYVTIATTLHFLKKGWDPVKSFSFWKFGCRLNTPAERGWGVLCTYIYIYICIWPLFVDGMQLSVLFTRKSWYSSDQYRKHKRLRWPWSYPVVLNLCINLVIITYKLNSQFKLTELWPLTVNFLKVSSQSYLAGLSKICFFTTYVDQMIIQ